MRRSNTVMLRPQPAKPALTEDNNDQHISRPSSTKTQKLRVLLSAQRISQLCLIRIVTMGTRNALSPGRVLVLPNSHKYG